MIIVDSVEQTPLRAVEGDARAPGGWVAWRGAEVWVCWPDPKLATTCSNWRRAWPASDEGGVQACRPEAAAFVDPHRVVVRCGLDDEVAWLVQRSDARWQAIAPGDARVRAHRPTSAHCGTARHRVVSTPGRSAPEVVACHGPPADASRVALGPAAPPSSCAAAAAGDLIGRLRRPRGAGWRVHVFAELAVGGRLGVASAPDDATFPDRRASIASTVIVGLELGFDTQGRAAWRREYHALRRRAHRTRLRCAAATLGGER